MGSGGKKKDERRNDMWHGKATEDYQETKEASPLQKKWEQFQMDFLDWDASDGKDVRDAPGMDKYVQLADLAQQRSNVEQMGTGAMALAGPGAEGNVKQLQSLRKKELDQDIGSGLERALAARRAEASNSVIPLANLDINRRQTNLGFLGNMVQSTRPQQGGGSWWQQALGAGVSAGVGLI